MKHLNLAIIVVCTVLAACSVSSAQVKLQVFETLEVHLGQLAERGLFTGTVLVSSCETGDIYASGFGYADKNWGIRNSVDTKFRVASVTKQFTAATILKLVEAGDISLKDPISKFLPNYPKPVSETVTIHNLLSHTSGIPNFFTIEGAQEELPFIRQPRDILRIFQNEPLDFPTNSKFSYSNSNYIVLGMIIETVTGQSYGEAMDRLIFAPLDLKNTGHYLEDINITGVASEYVRNGGEFTPVPYYNSRSVFSGGMAYSSARDLHTFNCALHSDNVFDKHETLEKMITPQFENSRYGYGQLTDKLAIGNQSVLKIGHGGDLPGIAAQNWFLPEDKVSVVVLANTNGNLSRERALEIVHILYGEDPSEPQIDPYWEIPFTIRREGVEAAIERFKTGHALLDGKDIWTEGVLNASGYDFMGTDMHSDAIRLFEFTVEQYPESANAWDSLAEAYLIDGQNFLALQNYRKALEIDPSLKSAQNGVRNILKVP